jgi:hypothetical protein
MQVVITFFNLEATCLFSAQYVKVINGSFSRQYMNFAVTYANIRVNIYKIYLVHLSFCDDLGVHSV